MLDPVAIDGSSTKAPGGGEVAGRFTGRLRQTGPETLQHDGWLWDPLGRVLAGANRHDSPLPDPTRDLLVDLGPLPEDITVHLDAGYDSDKTHAQLAARGLHGQISHKGEKAPIQASQRWHIERTHAWQNAFHRLARCYERRAMVIDAFFDLADAIIIVRSPRRRAWTTHCWDNRPNRRP
ncbi:transposase [Streptomyces sp. NPDC058409]|uniref:transposase n=1 Tax=Streptomyces sp. NPDC058409 TaxID=3346484 RepID=UPI003652DC13